MALKIISGTWISANDENREIRNSKRDEMFQEAGIKPAASMREIHVPAQSRLSRTEALFPDAAGSRIKDDNLSKIVGHMQAALMRTGLSAPQIMPTVEQKSLGIVAYSPELLRLFFETDLLTSLEQSISD